ncbi:unnamed protein product [Durusdinium trenchii]|uniref:Uncharacterized protein n=1 Tax=Durusdinium trenchii TaxID=1381693 RepID=A0ABP0RRH0_9DINO
MTICRHPTNNSSSSGTSFPKQQTEVEQQDDLETMSHTTGEDSSVADSQGLSRRPRKKRNHFGRGFQQPKCLDEGVEVPVPMAPLAFRVTSGARRRVLVIAG